MLFLSKIKKQRQSKSQETTNEKKNKKTIRQKKKFIQNRIKHFLLTYTPGNQVGGGRVDLEYDWHSQCHCAGENWFSTNRAAITWNSFLVKCDTLYLLPFLSAGILEDTAVTAGRELMKTYSLLNRQDSYGHVKHAVLEQEGIFREPSCLR